MINDKLLKVIRDHAAQEAPRECCGVIVVKRGKQRYVPCKNVAEGTGSFEIDQTDYNAAEDSGVITHIVHSHVNHSPAPSEADLVGCETSGLPWIIVNTPDGHYEEISPSGYSAPLVGRNFQHGSLDCYSLLRDYYARELGIDLMDFDRGEEWWTKGDNLYLENFEKAGFVEVSHDDLRPHDILLMQVASPVPNHAAIYLGDEIILQHCMGRLSSRDVYGGYWQRCVMKVVRHRSLLDA